MSECALASPLCVCGLVLRPLGFVVVDVVSGARERPTSQSPHAFPKQPSSLNNSFLLLLLLELEEESPIINWSLELGTRLDSRLYALWNRTAGDCLLDSVLQATWGIYDKDSVLRKTLHDSLHDCSHW